jgi:hypothetical protein
MGSEEQNVPICFATLPAYARRLRTLNEIALPIVPTGTTPEAQRHSSDPRSTVRVTPSTTDRRVPVAPLTIDDDDRLRLPLQTVLDDIDNTADHPSIVDARHAMRQRKERRNPRHLARAQQKQFAHHKARDDWKKMQPTLDPKQLVFVDETGTNTQMTRLRGRCAKGKRLVDYGPMATGKRRPSWPACAATPSRRRSSSTAR